MPVSKHTVAFEMSSNFSGCNIGYRTLLAEWGKLPLKFTCIAGNFTCPATGELHCADCAQNITCLAGKVRVLFCLPDCRFFPNSLVTRYGAIGYVARCFSKSASLLNTSFDKYRRKNKNFRIALICWYTRDGASAKPGSFTNSPSRR